MYTIIQSTPAWQLRASITPICGDQHHLMVTSLVPTARRAQEHVRWQAQLSVDELRSLRDIIDKALAQAG
jgi:hypothetical protein